MLEIIEAGVADIAKVAPLFDRYRQFYGKTPDLELAENFLRDRITRGESKIFLALSERLPAGFIQLYPSFTSAGAARIWILNDLYVEADRRRDGVGSALLSTARAFAERTGAAKLVLSTATDNYAAQALYEKMDWRRDDAFFNYELKCG